MPYSKNLLEGNILLGKSADFDDFAELLNIKSSGLSDYSPLYGIIYIDIYIFVYWHAYGYNG